MSYGTMHRGLKEIVAPELKRPKADLRQAFKNTGWVEDFEDGGYNFDDKMPNLHFGYQSLEVSMVYAIAKDYLYPLFLNCIGLGEN